VGFFVDILIYVMSILEKFLKLEAISPVVKVGVIGDAMLDEYFNVRVKKISPEFPIPVMHSDTDKSEDFPGGAANVVYQFKNFNAEVNLISFTDTSADISLRSKGINTVMCVNICTRIPRKRRFYSDDFPTYRWDVEQPNYGLGSDLDKKCFELYEKAQQAARHFDVLIFSDYDKGVFSRYFLIPECPITIVDPKSGDLDRWRGCTVFKPNKQEALALSGYSTVNEAGNYLLQRLECQSVIITQAGQGVTVFDQEGVYEIRPTQPLPPAESVIGAGDCFTSFLAMSLGYGMKIREAAEVAWRAGSLYVTNRHNKPLSRADILHTFNPTANKIIDTHPELIFHNRKYKLVFTNGCFDILHAGHLETLRYARSLGDKLVVAVNTDESVAKLKPGRPFVSLNDRMTLLAGLEFVDFVVAFSESTPLEIIKQIKPDVLVKGGEYKKEDIVGYGIVNEVVTVPMVSGLSTTNIFQKIKTQIESEKPVF
jgi:D-beta-D-heptose 7-phosphate kinase / D-beta-D-heptose 1-phosphate adenosyltransferase